MNWIINNWSLLVVLACAFGAGFIYVQKYVKLPYDEQMLLIREFLLWAVIATEKELGKGTGAAKLRYCYSLFVDKFPSLVDAISFDRFSGLVDEALERMRHLLATNKDINTYVYGEKEE